MWASGTLEGHDRQSAGLIAGVEIGVAHRRHAARRFAKRINWLFANRKAS